MSRAEAKIFSRVSPDAFDHEQLLIYREDQHLLPEDQQLPSVSVALEEGGYRCIWTSRESLVEAQAKMSRIFRSSGNSIETNLPISGFWVEINGVELSYEGDHEGPTAPRFVCTAVSLPVKPLSQLIASTALGRGLSQRRVEELIRDFVKPVEVLQ